MWNVRLYKYNIDLWTVRKWDNQISTMKLGSTFNGFRNTYFARFCSKLFFVAITAVCTIHVLFPFLSFGAPWSSSLIRLTVSQSEGRGFEDGLADGNDVMFRIHPVGKLHYKDRRVVPAV